MSIEIGNGIGNSCNGGGGSQQQVALLSITTAPSGEFAKGSKYYNSTTKKIYTATTADTWTGATESDPQFNVIYTYDNDGTTEYYQWDGDNLVETDLEKYSIKPTVITDGDNTGLVIQANKIYKFATALTTLTITSAEVSDYESVIYFTTGGTIAFTDNSNLKWGGDGSAPSLEANTIYCISIRNGLAEYDTFGTVS